MTWQLRFEQNQRARGSVALNNSRMAASELVSCW
jgi:hypothetical protein